MSLDALVAAFSNRLTSVASVDLSKDAILFELKAAAAELLDPGVQFDTEYKRKKFFTENRNFIRPEEITIGSRYERVHNQSLRPTEHRRIFHTFQYVPIVNTLANALSKESLQSELQFAPESSCEIMSSALHGSKAKRICDACGTREVIFLEMFYDELETTNPLGSKTGVHKLGAFYYVIKNLPQYLNSSMPNIYRIPSNNCLQ